MEPVFNPVMSRVGNSTIGKKGHKNTVVTRNSFGCLQVQDEIQIGDIECPKSPGNGEIPTLNNG